MCTFLYQTGIQIYDQISTPCSLSALEILQSCPSQRKTLLSTLGVNDDNSSSIIKFETAGLQPHLPYYVSLLIYVECLNMTVKRTMIDEGTVASVMYLSCWKGLGSPELSQSATMLTAFDGRSFRPYGILPSLKVRLGGKTVAIEVKVVDAPLDYNLLLGQNWMYSMQAVASSLFQVVCFPFNGKIVTIDQTSFKIRVLMLHRELLSRLSIILSRQMGMWE